MAVIHVPGREEIVPPEEPVRGRTGEALSDFGLRTEVRRSVRVEATRAGGDRAEVAAAEDDILELIMEGGARLYVRGSEVEVPPIVAGKRPTLPRGDRPYEHPFYWAAFFLAGDPD